MILLCVGLILLGTFAQIGREANEESNRTVWVAVFACLILALALPNPWLGVLMALIGVNVLQIPQRRSHIEPHVYTALVWGGLYLVLTTHLTSQAIPVLLGGIAVAASAASLWALHSLYIKERPYVITYQKGWLKWRFYETQQFHIIASLGNPNHAHAIYTCGLAASIGLVLMGYVWAWWCVGLIALPILGSLLVDDGMRYPSMLYGYLAAIALSFLPFYFEWIGWMVSVGIGASVAGWTWMYHPIWLGYRDTLWAWAVTWHTSLPWWKQVLGSGTGAWLPLIDRQRPFPSAPTNPHSEWLAMLIDHGYVGVLVLAGYLVTAFWKASHTGAAGKAVFLVGAVLAACATVSFPWHNYIEVGSYQDERGPVKLTGHGSTGLNVFSLVTAVMVEVL